MIRSLIFLKNCEQAKHTVSLHWEQISGNFMNFKIRIHRNGHAARICIYITVHANVTVYKCMYTVHLLPARIHIRMYSTVQYLYLIPVYVYSIYVCVYILCTRC